MKKLRDGEKNYQKQNMKKIQQNRFLQKKIIFLTFLFW